jgi:rhodanese-related sulfurtransferase
MFLSKFASLPPRKRMGILAIILGILAIFADSPYNKVTANVNLKDLAINSSKDVDRVKIEDLADWLIKGKMDYRLIDLRREEDFLKYNIPSSENITIENLLAKDLQRNDKILLYSDDDFSSSQAWFLLKSSSFKSVSVLKGGLDKWKSNILFPACNCNENPSTAQLHKHNKLAEVSKFFGGKIQTERISDTKNNFEMPELAAPVKVTLKRAKGKKKREGC